MTSGVFPLVLGFTLPAVIQCTAADRIDPVLKRLATTGQPLRVLIVLTKQPQRDIVRQTEETWQAEKDAAWKRIQVATGSPFSLEQDVTDARAELDWINLAIRRSAMEKIHQAIQPQQDSVLLLLRSYGATNIRPYSVTNAMSAQVPPRILSALEADSDIAGVFPVARLHPQLSVSVPAILAPTFWSAYSQGTGESVGILDSGIDSGNPGFSGLNIVGKVFLREGSADPCFADNASTANDLLGHGTHVSGIVASRGAGSCPNCVGVAPAINTLYALKVGWVVSSTKSGCSGGGAADDDDVLDGIDWAIQNTTVNVFNFSYGGTTSSDDDSFSQLLDQIGDVFGVNIVIAAGNAGNGATNVDTPGISYNGVTVASMDDMGTIDRSDDALSSWSLTGPTAGGRNKPDIAAPGNHGGNGYGGIVSTCINGDYCQMEGTSMATPHVAGSLALIRSAGAQDGLAAKAVLLNSAYSNVHAGWLTIGGWLAKGGWGFVDLSQASAQVHNYFRASAIAAQPAFYAGTVNGTLKSTLVWNRHLTGSGALTSSLSNLDLYAYDGASGNMIGTSTSTIQNVEQVIAADNGTAVLAVVPVSIAGVASEPYALAVSTAGFTAKNGPALTVSCTGPSGSVIANTTFVVPCTVKNGGDLTAFAVSGTLNWQGSPAGPINQFGNAGAGQQTGAQVWQIAAPATAGSYTLNATVSSSSYGQTFTAASSVTVVVAADPPQTYTLTTSASPSNAGVIEALPVAAGVVYVAGTQVCLTAAPNPGWQFNSWSGTALDQSNCVVINANASVTANFVPAPLLFVPMTPCRGFDTRNAAGPFGGPSIAANGTRSFTLPNSTACSIPATAAAYSLNVTVVPHGVLGYVTIWPAGQSQPTVSTLNSYLGEVKANAAIVPAGTGGAVSVFASDTTDVILDVDGYFVPVADNSSSLSFYPLNPCRVADTRNSSGPLGAPSMGAQTSRAFPVQSATSCNIPASARAYSLNFTVVPRASVFSYLTTWPAGENQPLVSTLNAYTGTVTANAAIVPAGTGGQIEVYVTDAADVVLDINGYFAPPGAGGLSLYNLTPCRVLDTRNPPGTPPFQGTLNVNVEGSSCGAPSSAQAYILNATVVPPGVLSYLTLWPQGETQPLVSTLNADEGTATSNMAIVSTNNGSIGAYVTNPTQLIIDIFGYFAR
jgi:hypothetical protein